MVERHPGNKGLSPEAGSGGTGGEGIAGDDDATATGETEESERDEQKVANIPDDIPIDGSGDDLVAQQIREAAISMQDADPKAAEKLWDEYRKHTGIK